MLRPAQRKVEQYARKLTATTRPATVAVCFLYNLDERRAHSWANGTLSLLGYDTNPKRLQRRMAIIYQHTTRAVSLDGTRVVPVPLFEAMDGR